MNSKSQPLYFVVVSLLSTTPAFQNAGAGTCLTSSNDIALVNSIQRSAVDYASASFAEQYTPSVDYRGRYRRISASENFKAAYKDRSLGENILIEE